MENFSDEQLAKLILQTIPLIARTMDASIRQATPHFLPAHFGLLMLLVHSPALPQSELAEKLHISPSTFSATVDALVKRGWIKREAEIQDRRVVLIKITEAGREILDQTDRQAIAALSKIITTIGENERKEIIIGLTALRKAFIEGMAKSANQQTSEFPIYPPPEGAPFPPPEGMPFPPPFGLPFPE